jgi:hypothetical protein
MRLADVPVLGGDRLHRQLRRCRKRRRRTRANRRLPSSSDSHSSDPCGPRCCSSASGGTFAAFRSGCEVATSLAATRPIRNAGGASLSVRLAAPRRRVARGGATGAGT